MSIGFFKKQFKSYYNLKMFRLSDIRLVNTKDISHFHCLYLTLLYIINVDIQNKAVGEKLSDTPRIAALFNKYAENNPHISVKTFFFCYPCLIV